MIQNLKSKLDAIDNKTRVKWLLRLLIAMVWIVIIAHLDGFTNHKNHKTTAHHSTSSLLPQSIRKKMAHHGTTTLDHHDPANASKSTSWKPNEYKDPAITVKNLPQLLKDDNLAGLVSGHGPTHLVVFIDPNCIYCHFLWLNLQDPKFKDKFTITYVPVAFLKKSSLGKAEMLLAQGHKPYTSTPFVRTVFSGGKAAVLKDEYGFRLRQEEGNLKPLKNAALAKIIVRNTREWEKLVKAIHQNPGTPTILIGKDKVLLGSPNPHILEDWIHGE